MALQGITASYCMAVDLLHNISMIDLLYLFIFASLLSYSLCSVWMYLTSPHEELPPNAPNPHEGPDADEFNVEAYLEAWADSLNAKLEDKYAKLRELVSLVQNLVLVLF